MRTIPIYDYECADCKEVFESVEIWESHRPKECTACGSPNISRIFSGKVSVRMDADVMKHNLPDPVPPLEELRGKNQPGCEGGFQDKPEASTNLNNYTRSHDKYGNTIWKEKERMTFDFGKNLK